MERKVFSKQFTGDRAKKAYFNELAARRKFPDITAALVSSSEEEMKVVCEYINGDTQECSDETLSAIGSTLGQIHNSSLLVQPWKDSWLLKRPMLLQDEALRADIIRAKARIVMPKTGIIHGDYRRRNILSVESGIKVVDWEFMSKDFIYWDFGIFAADYIHQKYHGLQSNSLIPFWEGYTKEISLEESEKDFGALLGASWIIADHIIQEDRLPVPEELFVGFNAEEQEFLLNRENYI